MLNIKIGLSTSVIHNSKSNLFPIFLLAKKLNIYTIEIILSEKEKTANQTKNEISFKQFSNNFEFFFHAYDIELNRLHMQFEKIKMILNLCYVYNAHRLIIHPGFEFLDSKLFVKYKRIFNIAEKMGIMILIENGYKQDELFQSVEEQSNIIKKIRRTGITNVYAAFDVWRAFKVFQNTEKIVESIESLMELNLLKHIHFSDGKESLNTSVALGDGEIDIDLLLHALKDFDDYLIIEVDSPEDAIKSVKYLKNKNIL